MNVQTQLPGIYDHTADDFCSSFSFYLGTQFGDPNWYTGAK